MVGVRSCLCALAAAAACSGYPRPPHNGDANGVDPDASVDIDAGVDGPQGVLPTAGTSAITGTTDVGSVLTATHAGFTLGMPAGTYHYQWQRCGSPCTSPIAIGSDAATYTLVSADAGAYVHVGIYVTNTCMAGCGSSSTAYSALAGLVRRVDLTKGAACVVLGCASGCNWMTVSPVGFSGGSHTVTCNASNTTNPFDTYSTSTFPSNVCCYGFPGQTTWATVDGLRSNNKVW